MRDLTAQVTSSLLQFPEVTLQALGEDEITLDSVLCGKFSGGRNGLAWLACGPQLEVVNSVTGEHLSAYRFSGVDEQPPTVRVVKEFSWQKRTGLLIGLEEAEGSVLCLYDLGVSRVVKAVVLPGRVTAIEPIANHGGASVRTQHLHQSLRWLSGVAAVATDVGHLLLVDLCLDDLSYNWNGIEALDLEVVTRNPAEVSLRRESVTREGRHLCFQLQNPSGIAVSTLCYISRSNQLVVGFSDGYLSLWNMKTLKREHHSQLEGGEIPVYAVTFQEPENDPRNCCYLWAVQSTQESEGDVVSLHLLQLAFGDRKRLASGQVMYEGLEYCDERYSVDLTGGVFPLRGQIRNIKLISCQTVEKFPTRVDSEDSVDKVISPETSVSIFSWQVNTYDQETPSTYLGVFDINRWYHAQMPDSLRPEEFLHDCPYFALWSLDTVISMTSPKLLLDILVHERSLSRGVPPSYPPPEQFFNPSTYNFDGTCLLNSGVVHMTCTGFQKETLNFLKKSGPLMCEAIPDSYSRCLVADFQSPGLVDVQPSSLSQNDRDPHLRERAVGRNPILDQYGKILPRVQRKLAAEKAKPYHLPSSLLREVSRPKPLSTVAKPANAGNVCPRENFLSTVLSNIREFWPEYEQKTGFSQGHGMYLNSLPSLVDPPIPSCSAAQSPCRAFTSFRASSPLRSNVPGSISQKNFSGTSELNFLQTPPVAKRAQVLATSASGVPGFTPQSILRSSLRTTPLATPSASPGRSVTPPLRPKEPGISSREENSNATWTAGNDRDPHLRERAVGRNPILDQYGKILPRVQRKLAAEKAKPYHLPSSLLREVSRPKPLSTVAKPANAGNVCPRENFLSTVLSNIREFWPEYEQKTGFSQGHGMYLNSLPNLVDPPIPSCSAAQSPCRAFTSFRASSPLRSNVPGSISQKNFSGTSELNFLQTPPVAKRAQVLATSASGVPGFTPQSILRSSLRTTPLATPSASPGRSVTPPLRPKEPGISSREENSNATWTAGNDRDPHLRERAVGRNPILDQYGKILPRVQRKLAAEKAKPYHLPSSLLREVSRPKPLSTVAKPANAGNVCPRENFLSTVLSNIREFWPEYEQKTGFSQGHGMYLNSLPNLVDPPIPSCSAAQSPCRAFTSFRASSPLRSNVPGSISQKNFSGTSELNFLQTPPVAKRAQVLATSASGVPGFTPQSILRSSLRTTPLATPSASPGRSVTPPLRPKEPGISSREENSNATWTAGVTEDDKALSGPSSEDRHHHDGVVEDAWSGSRRKTTVFTLSNPEDDHAELEESSESTPGDGLEKIEVSKENSNISARSDQTALEYHDAKSLSDFEDDVIFIAAKPAHSATDATASFQESEKEGGSEMVEDKPFQTGQPDSSELRKKPGFVEESKAECLALPEDGKLVFKATEAAPFGTASEGETSRQESKRSSSSEEKVIPVAPNPQLSASPERDSESVIRMPDSEDIVSTHSENRLEGKCVDLPKERKHEAAAVEENVPFRQEEIPVSNNLAKTEEMNVIEDSMGKAQTSKEAPETSPYSEQLHPLGNLQYRYDAIEQQFACDLPNDKDDECDAAEADGELFLSQSNFTLVLEGEEGEGEVGDPTSVDASKPTGTTAEGKPVNSVGNHPETQEQVTNSVSTVTNDQESQNTAESLPYVPEPIKVAIAENLLDVIKDTRSKEFTSEAVEQSIHETIGRKGARLQKAKAALTTVPEEVEDETSIHQEEYVSTPRTRTRGQLSRSLSIPSAGAQQLLQADKPFLLGLSPRRSTRRTKEASETSSVVTEGTAPGEQIPVMPVTPRRGRKPKPTTLEKADRSHSDGQTLSVDTQPIAVTPRRGLRRAKEAASEVLEEANEAMPLAEGGIATSAASKRIRVGKSSAGDEGTGQTDADHKMKMAVSPSRSARKQKSVRLKFTETIVKDQEVQPSDLLAVPTKRGRRRQMSTSEVSENSDLDLPKSSLPPTEFKLPVTPRRSARKGAQNLLADPEPLSTQEGTHSGGKVEILDTPRRSARRVPRGKPEGTDTREQAPAQPNEELTTPRSTVRTGRRGRKRRSILEEGPGEEAFPQGPGGSPLLLEDINPLGHDETSRTVPDCVTRTRSRKTATRQKLPVEEKESFLFSPPLTKLTKKCQAGEADHPVQLKDLDPDLSSQFVFSPPLLRSRRKNVSSISRTAKEPELVTKEEEDTKSVESAGKQKLKRGRTAKSKAKKSSKTRTKYDSWSSPSVEMKFISPFGSVLDRAIDRVGKICSNDRDPHLRERAVGRNPILDQYGKILPRVQRKLAAEKAKPYHLPSSLLREDGTCLLNSGVVHMTCTGFQKETLNFLKKSGPLICEAIPDSYSRCLVADFQSPGLVDVQPSSLSQNDRDPHLRERAVGRNPILDQYGKILPRVQRKLAAEKAKPYHLPSSLLREVSRPKPLSTVAKPANAGNVCPRENFLSTVLSNIREFWPEYEQKTGFSQGHGMYLNSLPSLVDPPIPSCSAAQSPCRAFTSFRASSPLRSNMPGSISQKNFSGTSELNFLQTPPVAKRAQVLATSASGVPGFTPQSILRSSLRTTPLATPSASPGRSVTPPLRPKEPGISSREENSNATWTARVMEDSMGKAQTSKEAPETSPYSEQLHPLGNLQYRYDAIEQQFACDLPNDKDDECDAAEADGELFLSQRNFQRQAL